MPKSSRTYHDHILDTIVRSIDAMLDDKVNFTESVRTITTRGNKLLFARQILTDETTFEKQIVTLTTEHTPPVTDDYHMETTK